MCLFLRNMIKLVSLRTRQLDNVLKRKIFILKKEKWNYSLNKQNLWFSKNIHLNDIHNCLFINKNLIGYTLLRRRTFVTKKLKMKYFYFDTLIIKQSHRKKGISRFLMELNSYQIKKYKTTSILVCNTGMQNYYRKFGWQTGINKEIKFLDYDLKKKMVFMKYGKIHSESKFYINK